jgi:hypothetical protein
LVKKNIIRSIEPPPVSEAVIQIMTKEEIDLLLKACDTTRTWKSRAETSSARFTGARDRAIILTLLDTGVRASELCGIKYCEVCLFCQKLVHISPSRPGLELVETLFMYNNFPGQKMLSNSFDQEKPAFNLQAQI